MFKRSSPYGRGGSVSVSDTFIWCLITRLLFSLAVSSPPFSIGVDDKILRNQSFTKSVCAKKIQFKLPVLALKGFSGRFLRKQDKSHDLSFALGGFVFGNQRPWPSLKIIKRTYNEHRIKSIMPFPRTFNLILNTYLNKFFQLVHRF